ncbi:MAG: DegT/DnrJ/EryC1/StrS family aminotransferase [Planctomycetota bacterium]
MQVPLFDPKPQIQAIRNELLATYAEIIDSGRFIGGPHVEAFEKEVAEAIGAQHAVAVSSGTDALLVTLMALGVRAGDEVLTSPFTFFATAGAIVRLGATPVFADIDPESFNLSADRAYDYIDEGVSGGRKRTESVRDHTSVKVVLPVHLFGQCAEMKPYTELAEELSLMIVEDAAQAMMATYDGAMAGTLGDAGCFSFYPTKNLGGLGDGGMVTTDDPSLAQTLRILRDHGQSPAYHHSEVGGNFRLDALQAAALRLKLKHVPRWLEARREAASTYASLFEEKGLLDHVILPRASRHRDHTYNQYVIRVDQRDELRSHLGEMGIGTAIYYPEPLHLQPCFRYLGYQVGDFPEAERAAREVLAIPIYPGITPEQQAAVVEAIAVFYVKK